MRERSATVGGVNAIFELQELTDYKSSKTKYLLLTERTIHKCKISYNADLSVVAPAQMQVEPEYRPYILFYCFLLFMFASHSPRCLRPNIFTSEMHCCTWGQPITYSLKIKCIPFSFGNTCLFTISFITRI